MSGFVKRLASNHSFANRRLMCGVGINDSDYKLTHLDEKGKQHMCPYYMTWSNMIKRCYSKSFLKDKGPFFWVKKMLLRNKKTNYTFSELEYNSSLKTVITPQWKYTYNYDDYTEQLYDIKSDPLEHNNLIDKEPRQGSELKDLLLKWISNSKKYPTEWKPWPVSPTMKEKLKELGYIQ